MILHLQLNKLTGFVGEKRARLSMFENVMDVFVPLVLNEMFQVSFESMQLSMRVSILCDCLRLIEPSTRYFNAVADRLVSSGGDYHAILKKAQGDHPGILSSFFLFSHTSPLHTRTHIYAHINTRTHLPHSLLSFLTLLAFSLDIFLFVLFLLLSLLSDDLFSGCSS